jgi:hypothetical protein
LYRLVVYSLFKKDESVVIAIPIEVLGVEWKLSILFWEEPTGSFEHLI